MSHTSQIKLRGLTCTACQKVVSMKLKKVPGVHDVVVDLATQTANITGERSITTDEVMHALVGTDYTVIS